MNRKLMNPVVEAVDHIIIVSRSLCEDEDLYQFKLYNADETGFFNEALPWNTYIFIYYFFINWLTSIILII